MDKNASGGGGGVCRIEPAARPCSAPFVDFPSFSARTPVGAPISIGARDFSIALLVRPFSLEYAMLASKDRCGVASNQFRLELHASGKVALFGLGVPCGCGPSSPRPDSADPNGWSSSLTSAHALDIGRWSHVVLSRSRGAYTLYLDGAASASVHVDASAHDYAHDNAVDLRIGSRYPPGASAEMHNSLRGDVQRALFMWASLSADEVAKLASESLRAVGALPTH